MHRHARLLAVFGLLVGLLAMHGLHGEHSAMGGWQPMVAGAVEPAQWTRSLAAPAVPAVAHVHRPSDRAMTSMAVLCLAILSSGLTLGLLGRATRPARGMTDRSGLGPWLRRAGPTPRPPDLVGGLCVSRT